MNELKKATVKLQPKQNTEILTISDFSFHFPEDNATKATPRVQTLKKPTGRLKEDSPQGFQ